MHRDRALAIALLLTALAFILVMLFNRPAFAECSGRARCFAGNVTKIVDGDTIDVGGRRIRLVLVDTPERGEAGFGEATEFTKNLCLNKNAIVDQDDLQPYDDYGRMLAVVYCNNVNVNAALLENNHAVLYEIFCSQSEFGASAWARKAGC